MFNKPKKGPAPVGGSGKASAPKSTGNGKTGSIVGNITAYKKDEATGEVMKEEIAVIFSKDGRSISSAPGKLGSEFEGITFFLNAGSKASPKHWVLEDR